MTNFFDDPICPEIPEDNNCPDNGGTSNEVYLNDYRNRMPFHYIEDPNSDGYYYWQYGATMQIQFTLENDFAITTENENLYISIVDFFKGSTTKKVVFILNDFRGNEFDRQEVLAKDLIVQDNAVIAYYVIQELLSSKLLPNQYKLFIYVIDELPASPEGSMQMTIAYNKCLTEQGISIRVRS